MVYQKKLVDKIRCPFEYGLEVLGGKWKSRVLCLLSNCGPMRFRDLKQEMDSISDGVLSAALSDLMREGIISREAFNEVPPRVEYMGMYPLSIAMRTSSMEKSPSGPMSNVASSSGTALSKSVYKSSRGISS